MRVEKERGKSEKGGGREETGGVRKCKGEKGGEETHRKGNQQAMKALSSLSYTHTHTHSLVCGLWFAYG